MKSIYTYNKDSRHYTDRCNRAMNYVCRNLKGVRVTFECGDWVQIEAETREAKEAIDAFWYGDLMEIYPDRSIKDVMELLDLDENGYE